ncbi:MAG: hypothetical protein D6815_07695, partial [Candidatus Dadabacteria bacterium]
GGQVEQLTFSSETPACDSGNVRISSDGAWVLFDSFCDLTGANGDGGIEIFRTNGAGTLQLTAGATCSSGGPAVASDSGAVFFVSNCDGGSNPDGSQEVFSVPACFCGSPVRGHSPPDLPTVVDALFVLQSAVGQSICAPCECDVNSDEQISATDALAVLRASVGQPVVLACP